MGLKPLLSCESQFQAVKSFDKQESKHKTWNYYEDEWRNDYTGNISNIDNGADLLFGYVPVNKLSETPEEEEWAKMMVLCINPEKIYSQFYFN